MTALLILFGVALVIMKRRERNAVARGIVVLIKRRERAERIALLRDIVALIGQRR